jgi:hypothetical protein
MKHIRLGNSGRVALVDDRDFGRLRRVAWGVVPVRGSVDVYAKTGRSTYMHHLVIGKRSGFEIDHIDGNRLNNTRANLRHVTHSQNIINSKVRSDSTSGVSGVAWLSTKKRWQATIMTSGKRKHLGTFRVKADAVRARRDAESLHHGEYARRQA